MIQAALKAEAPKYRLGDRALLALILPRDHQRNHDVFERCQVRHQVERLEQETE